MPTTYHVDLGILTEISDRIAKGNFDLYAPVEGIKLIGPPGMFYFDGALFYITEKITNFNFNYQIFYDYASFHSKGLFIMKLRYLLFFIFSFFVFRKIAKLFDFNKNKIITDLWITSPVLFFSTFTQGNNDIYPVFFTTLSIYFFLKKKNLLSIVFLGIAACLKNYALFLIFPLSLILAEKNTKKTFLYSTVGFLIYLLPALTNLKEFMHFLQGGNEGSSIFDITLFSFPVFLLLYFFIILYLIFITKKEEIVLDKNNYFIKCSFLVLSLFFVTHNFLSQWFLWILPFFILIIYKNKILFYLSTFINSVYFLVIAFCYPRDRDLNLFRPIFDNDIISSAFLSNNLITSDPRIRIILRTIFVVSLLIFIYSYIYKQKKQYIELSKYYLAINLVPIFFHLGPVLFYLLYEIVAKPALL